jgi:ribosome-associated heat shock protein Hsp15
MSGKVRIDKWLWAVRVFKTRNKATLACKKGRILVNDMPVKPSHEVNEGEIVKVKRAPVIRSYRVLATAEKRMSAAAAEEFVEEVTPEEELEVSKMQKQMGWESRRTGSGRPTKKERRDLDDFFNYH